MISDKLAVNCMMVCGAETNACDSADCDQTCVLTHTDNTASAAYRCMCQTGFQPSTANLSHCVSTSLHAHPHSLYYSLTL